MKSPVKPTGGSGADKLKLIVSFLYALAPLSLMVYRLANGERVDSIILLIVVMMIFASAYVIFGEAVVDKATEKAEDVTGEGGDEDGS